MKKCRATHCPNDVERDGHLVCRECVRALLVMRDGSTTDEAVNDLFDTLNAPVPS
jgi:hypothetical protein